MTFVYNDGGKPDSVKNDNDCTVRAINIATGLGYKEVAKRLRKAARNGRAGNGTISRGVYREDTTAALKELGWVWCKAPKFNGRKARYYDMPSGTVIVSMAHHISVVIDGKLHDTFDCREKMVYGYWAKQKSEILSDA